MPEEIKIKPNGFLICLCVCSVIVALSVEHYLHKIELGSELHFLIDASASIAIAMSIAIFFYFLNYAQLNSSLIKNQETLNKNLNYEKAQKCRYRTYADAVVTGQEKERLRLARELHDETIQQFVVINQKIQILQMDHEKEAISEDLCNIQKLIDTSIESIRLFIRELRPSYLEKLGLISAMEDLISEPSEEIKLSLCVKGERYKMHNKIELSLFRVAQCAINNVIKHSAATHAKIQLTFSKEQLELLIEDNGIGFIVPNDLECVNKRQFGLLGMKERTEMIGGILSINTAPNAGTSLKVNIPRNNSIAKNIEAGNLQQLAS